MVGKELFKKEFFLQDLADTHYQRGSPPCPLVIFPPLSPPERNVALLTPSDGWVWRGGTSVPDNLIMWLSGTDTAQVVTTTSSDSKLL